MSRNKTPQARKRNKPGQGTTSPRQLASGRVVYDAQVTVIDPATRQPTKLAKRNAGDTDKQAQAWIALQVANAANGLRALQQKGMTVWACWTGWKETTPLKESTVLEYERLFISLCEDWKDLPVTAVTQIEMDRMIAGMRKRQVPTSRLVHLIITWGHIFNYAIAARAVQYNPAKQSAWRDSLFSALTSEKEARKLEKLEDEYVEVITTEQYCTLLASERRATMRNLWEYIGSTGSRRGEALALEWGDINLDVGTIWIRRGIADIAGELVHLPTPKGGRARRIYIDAETVELLKRQRQLVAEYRESWGDLWEEHDLVFPLLDIRVHNENPPGHWMLPSNLSETYFRRAKKLGFKSTKLHGLRFRWATMAYAAGVQLRDIQEHMGHRDMDLTAFTYIERPQAVKRDAVVLAGRAIRGEVEVAPLTPAERPLELTS